MRNRARHRHASRFRCTTEQACCGSLSNLSKSTYLPGCMTRTDPNDDELETATSIKDNRRMSRTKKTDATLLRAVCTAGIIPLCSGKDMPLPGHLCRIVVAYPPQRSLRPTCQSKFLVAVSTLFDVVLFDTDPTLVAYVSLCPTTGLAS